MTKRPTTRARRILFPLIALSSSMTLVLVSGELVLRYRVETAAPAKGPKRATWLVRDADLGFKLNPEMEAVNTLGIRHPEIDPHATLFTILILGDSVAWDARGFVSLLREELEFTRQRRIEVVNASVPGYTTYQERVFFERDLAHLTPDLVILQYCANDNHDSCTS